MAELKPFRLSASKLKRFLQCPRSYFLRYVQGVEDDSGGNYLAIGTAYDLHVQHYLSAGARGVRSIEPRIVRMFEAARRFLPDPGTVEVQTKYALAEDGFVVEGTPDLRRPGWLGDTKTTSASGPGEGSAMTDAQLEADIQFRLYAWCEFELGWRGPPVAGMWCYVNKDTKPKAWNVYASIDEDTVRAWFERVVRPAAAQMARLHDALDADSVRAELDACDRCWVRAACDPYAGPNSYDGVDVLLPAASLKRSKPPALAGVGGKDGMAFDLKKLSEDVDLTEALQASITAHITDEMTKVAAELDARPIPINPPRAEESPLAPTYLALEAAIAQCEAAAARAGELLARLRGGGQ